MGGAMTMTTFSIRASITTPGNYDRTTIAAGKRGRLYCPPSVADRTERAFCVPDGSSGIEGSLFRVDPSPRLRLGTFNGWRLTRESLIGNGAGAPPVSRFLYHRAL